MVGTKTLAEKQYIEKLNNTQDPEVCCMCLEKTALYYSNDDIKATDCNDHDHFETCWMCYRCMKTTGALW